MQYSAASELILASKPGAIALVGETGPRLKSVLLSSMSDAEQQSVGIPIHCAASLTDLHEQISQAAAGETDAAEHNAQAMNELSLYLHLPADTASPHNWIGAACRLAPKLVLIEHAKGQSTDKLLEDEQFFAHGFRKIDSAPKSANPESHWYAYSLREYKQAPDWLNARFWAHPERFGLMD